MTREDGATQEVGAGGQKRGRRIAMSAAERDAFLEVERTCRVASVGASGPHVTPLWFVWDGTALWLHSLSRSRRWAELAADPRVSVVVDAGTEYQALRGIELTGRVEVVGEVPRTGKPVPELVAAERQFARKYLGSESFASDGRHGWLRLVPEYEVSWDFRKLSGG
ncbi:MAG: pyridoxamine 5'-phosphate oxidase family protein [Mycobacteriaceae bacterium]